MEIDEFRWMAPSARNYHVTELTLSDLDAMDREVAQSDDRVMGYADFDDILLFSLDVSMEVLEGHGWEVERPDEVLYDPMACGLSYDPLEDTMVVGRPGIVDREYGLVAGMTHELVHKYVSDNDDGHVYSPREEAFTQVWNLYMDDMIEDGDACEERLASVRRAYNEYEPVADDFGDDIYDHANRFLNSLREDMEGSPTRRLSDLLDQYEERYIEEDGLSLD